MSGEGWNDQSNPGEFDPPPQRPGGGHPAGRVCSLALLALAVDLVVLLDGARTLVAS